MFATAACSFFQVCDKVGGGEKGLEVGLTARGQLADGLGWQVGLGDWGPGEWFGVVNGS